MSSRIAASTSRALELQFTACVRQPAISVRPSNVLSPQSRRGICTCLHNPSLHPLRPSTQHSTKSNARRTLHTTSPLYKQKGGKQNTKSNVVHASARADAAGNDPLDFSTLETSIASTLDRLTDELSKIKKGGRITTELIEGLRVELKTATGGGGGGPQEEEELGSAARKGKTGGGKKNKPSGAARETVTARVGELAQVVPRGGRSMVLFVGEEAHVKPIVSALLASNHNLNPTPDPHSPLELQLPVPPPTKESREAAAKEAGKAGEKAGERVKEARAAQQKTLRAMEVAKTVRIDEVVKAREKMEARVREAQGEVKKIVDGAKKALES